MSFLSKEDQKEFDHLMTSARADLDGVEARMRQALQAGVPDELIVVSSFAQLTILGDVQFLAAGLSVAMLELAKRETPIGGITV